MSTDNSTTIPELWYASLSHTKAWWKLRFYKDQGELEIRDDEMRFVGPSGELKLNQVMNISLPLIVPRGAITGLVNTNLFIFVLAWAEVLRLQSPLLYVLGAMNVLVPTFWPWRWVQIEHVDDTGEIRKDCFVEGRYLKRLTSGSQKVYQAILQVFNSPDSEQQES